MPGSGQMSNCQVDTFKGYAHSTPFLLLYADCMFNYDSLQICNYVILIMFSIKYSYAYVVVKPGRACYC